VSIPLAAFAWFWLWRSGVWCGGDSEHWEREINHGVWLRRRQMLSFASFQFVFTLGQWLGGWWSARGAIHLVSCAAGALALLPLWRLLRGRPQAPLAFAIVATAGFTTIFYGHIETYAQPVAALLLHLLALWRTHQRRWRPWTVAATFCLVMVFHLVILFALPATLVILAYEIRRRDDPWREAFAVALAALPGLLFWVGISRYMLGEGELVGPHFAALLGEILRRPWVLLSAPSNPLKLNFMFWDGGAAVLVALGVFARALRRPLRESFTTILFLYFLCFMGFFAIWNPDAGERDFDLFCFPWVIATLAAAWHAGELPWRPVLVGVILGVNAWLFLTRTAVFADLPNRGAGTILFEHTMPADSALVMLDDSFRIFPTNRGVPAGGHVVRATIGPRVWRRALNLRPGETVRLRLTPQGLEALDARTAE
jgi:hypothetical protein